MNASPGLPSREQLLALTTDELAYAMLVAFQMRDSLSGMPMLNDYSMNLFKTHHFQNYGFQDTSFPEKPLRDAWKKLQEWELVEPAEGMNGANGYMVLTDKGKRCTEKVDFEKIRIRMLLKPEMLHVLLRGKPFEDFAAGHFSEAIANAFKTIEIEIRKAAGLPDSDYGNDLIRKAFSEKGALFDAAEQKPYRDRIVELFTGAFGRFRNPNTHTKPEFADPRQAMEELMIASRLLRYIDERKPQRTGP